MVSVLEGGQKAEEPDDGDIQNDQKEEDQEEMLEHASLVPPSL